MFPGAGTYSVEIYFIIIFFFSPTSIVVVVGPLFIYLFIRVRVRVMDILARIDLSYGKYFIKLILNFKFGAH